MPSRTTGGAQRSSTARKLPMTAPAEASSSPSTVRSRNGSATNGIAATHTAAASTIEPRSVGSGLRSARSSAEPVAERKRREDDPDQVRPHDRRGAEVRGEQAGRGDLGRERTDAGAEDERPEREAARPPVLGLRCHRLQPEDALDLAERPRSEQRPRPRATSARTSQKRTPAHRFSRCHLLRGPRGERGGAGRRGRLRPGSSGGSSSERRSRGVSTLATGEL